MFKFNILKFYYAIMNNKLPDYFLHLNTITEAQIHDYNTRFKNNVRRIQVRHDFRRKYLHCEITIIANNTQIFKNQMSLKMCTHTALMDMFHLLKAMFKMYRENCHMEYCYICSRV